MKKYIISALAMALVGASIASIAQSAPMDHSSHDMGMQGMMGMDIPDMQAMQIKMAAAKTDEERQALMVEHQKLMAGKHGAMMGIRTGMDHKGKPGAMDHDSGAMLGMNPAEMQALRESMQKKLSVAKTDVDRQALMLISTS